MPTFTQTQPISKRLVTSSIGPATPSPTPSLWSSQFGVEFLAADRSKLSFSDDLSKQIASISKLQIFNHTSSGMFEMIFSDDEASCANTALHSLREVDNFIVSICYFDTKRHPVRFNELIDCEVESITYDELDLGNPWSLGITLSIEFMGMRTN